MKPIRFYFALWCGKLSMALLKLLHRRGTNFPGSVVLTLCPDFLGHIEKPEHIIAITGTNGKTTVSNMVLDILEDNGYDCTNNNFGGNVDTGICAAIMKDSTLTGKAKKQYCVLEVDERSAVRVFPHLTPEILIVTNLTRDSYRRNAHVEYIFSILDSNIPDQTHLVLNADDLISSSLKKGNPRTYFGMEPLEGEQLPEINIVRDITACPVCNSPLEYRFLRYNHIGRAKCSGCSFCSPEPDFNVLSKTSLEDGRSDIVIAHEGAEEHYRVPADRVINLYNVTAVIAALRQFGLTQEQLTASLQKIKVVASRDEIIEANGYTLRCIMAKGQNPVACSHSLNLARHTPDSAVILLWDDYHDRRETSENIAWYYDVDFEYLRNDNIRQIISAGRRSPDLLVRLLVADIPEDKIQITEHEKDVPPLLDLTRVKNIFIFFDMYEADFKDELKVTIEEMMKHAD